MDPHVDISFDCLPLRSVPRWDVPVDADPDVLALYHRIRAAAVKHGLHNSYYLSHGRCVFHLTNRPDLGMLAFTFEGTVLTDAQDRKPLGQDLLVQLEQETCDWLTAPVVAWFAETVTHAVMVDFERYAAATDSPRTSERIRQTELELLSHDGYVGLGL